MFFIKKNSYLKTKAEEESDEILKNPKPFEDTKRLIKQISKDTWTYFSKKYGGGPLVCFEFEEDADASLFPAKIDFYILPKRKQFANKDQLFNIQPHTAYISQQKTLNEITSYIETLIDEHELIKKMDEMFQIPNDNEDSTPNTDTPRFRYWIPCEMFPSLLKSKTLFSQYSQKISTTDELLDPNDTFDIIDIKYSSIGKRNSNSNSGELSVCYTIIIEQSPFIFSQSKLEFGYCKFCNRRNYLKYSCECKQAHYCRKDCFESDYHHKELCIIRIMSRIEKEMDISKNDNSLYGLVGLYNIGNTCFMNTSLQCLSNCYELTNYFLNDYFKSHINKDNPIGSKGILALNYAALIKHLWYGNDSSYIPRMFKEALGNYQRMFMGTRQHDTTEFLNFLLDGLHEDLNKVLKKPTISRNDDTVVSDSIASTNAWIDFLRRNQSVLVEIFYGQFKSTVKCPNSQCKNVSISFEPFMTLSLPMTLKVKQFQVKCYYIYYDINNKPLLLNFNMYNKTNIMALRHKIATVLKVHPMSFYVETFKSLEKVKEICSLNYELEKKMFNDNIENFFLFEIDPRIFYSKYNSHIDESEYAKAEETSEDISTSNEIDKYKERFNYVNSYAYKQINEYQEEMNNDNLGLDLNNLLRVIVKNYDSSAMKAFSIPRTLLLPRDMDITELYKYMFTYYISIIVNSRYDNEEDTKVYLDNDNKEDRNKAIDTLYNELFKDLLTNNNDNIDISALTSLPFRIFIRKKISYIRHTNYFIPFNKTHTVQSIEKTFAETHNNYLSMKLCITWNSTYIDRISKLIMLNSDLFGTIPKSKDKELSIYDCFDNFVTEETLEKDNTWYCPKCKKHQCASKKIEIYNPPNILIVNFKRFTNMSKIESLVTFPIEGLDIGKYVVNQDKKKESVYDLFAIGNHSGSLSFGHYYAYAKNFMKDKWYEFNDSYVNEIRGDDYLISTTAYVLFYRKRGSRNVNWEEIYQKPFKEYEGDYVKEEEKNSQREEKKEKENSNNDNKEQTDNNNTNDNETQENKAKQTSKPLL